MSELNDPAFEPDLTVKLAGIAALERAAAVMVESEDMREILQRIVDIASDVLRAGSVSLFTLDLNKRQVGMIVTARPAQDGRDPSVAESSAGGAGNALEKPRAATATPQAPNADPNTAPANTLTVPLNYCERMLGMIKAAKSPGSPPFSALDEALLAALANYAAMAIENDELRRSESRQRRQAETFQEVARSLIDSLDPQRVLELILDQLARVVDYDSASIMLLQDNRLTIAASRRLKSDQQYNVQGQASSYGHIREVIERRRPVIIDDTLQDARWQQIPTADYIRNWLGVPLIGRERVIGLLNLDKEQPGFYTSQDALLAVTFANHAAITIENARLFASERRRADQLNALRATVADISTELELPRLLGAILQRAVALCNSTGGELGLFDEINGVIKISASHNMGSDTTGRVMDIGEGAMGWAIQHRRPVVLDNYQTWDNDSSQYRSGPWHAVMAVPFLIGRRTIGAIGIVDQNPERRFNRSEQYLLSLFAQHAAIAVENARLYQNARIAAERRSVLHRVSQAIVSASLQPEEIYRAIHQAAARLMPSEAFVITRLNAQGSECTAVYLVDRDKRMPARNFPVSRGLSGLVITSGKSIIIGDIPKQESREDFIHFGEQETVKSILAAPMRLRGQVVGTISAQSYELNGYTADDQELLEMLASYAAIALDNAGMFQNIQQLAFTDSLTGLFNRRQIFELGQREFVRARRFGRPLSALMVDIDHFKRINDRYGHAAGDRVLRRLAQTMKTGIREIDIVGRYGGEEFTIILPESDLDTAMEIAARLQSQIVSAFLNRTLPEVTVSIGAADMTVELADFAALVHRADLVMYAAKDAGRNRIAAYRD